VVLVIVATFALARGEAENVTEEAIESGRIPIITDADAAAYARKRWGRRPAAATGPTGLARSQRR
jgi:hypothetical protein